MNQSSKGLDVRELFQKWEATVPKTNFSSNRCIPIPESRTDEFLDGIIDSFLYYDTDTIENILDAWLYRAFNDAEKKRSQIQRLNEDTLYVVKVHAEEEKSWRYVFGQTLLDIEVRVPTLAQVNACFKWRQACFKKHIKIARLKQEDSGGVERMFLRQSLSQLYSHVDMLYAPIVAWHDIVTRTPPQFRSRAIKKQLKMLRNVRVRRTFLVNNKAPFFMIKILDKELFDITSVLETMSD